MKKTILVSAAILFSLGSFAQTDSTNKMNQDMNNQMNPDMHSSMPDSSKINHQPMDKSHPDGAMMQNGKVMMQHNGKMTPMSQEMTMSNGTKVMSDGSYTTKEGKKGMLKEGEHIDMSGKIIMMKDPKMKKEEDSKMDNK